MTRGPWTNPNRRGSRMIGCHHCSHPTRARRTRVRRRSDRWPNETRRPTMCVRPDVRQPRGLFRLGCLPRDHPSLDRLRRDCLACDWPHPGNPSSELHHGCLRCAHWCRRGWYRCGSGSNDSSRSCPCHRQTSVDQHRCCAPSSSSATMRRGADEDEVLAAWTSSLGASPSDDRGNPDCRRGNRKTTNTPGMSRGCSSDKFGGDLLSQGVYPQVPSALAVLTSVFGMGTGVTLPL